MKTFKTIKPNTFFYVTSVTYNREPIFKSEKACKALVSVFEEVRIRFPYKLIAYVIMPDHFHVLVNLKDGDISKWLLRVRGNSAKRILAALDETFLQKLTLDSPQKRNHKYALWQKDPPIVDIYSNKFLVQKTGYIHANPVRAGLIDHPAKWQWSSYHAHFPHETGEVAIEIDHRPYWTDEELRAAGDPSLGVGR